EYTFFIESILQSMLRVGTKIKATVRTLGCGIMFFDEVISVYPTFDEFICNDLMVGWRAPKARRGAMDYVSDGEDEGDEGDEGRNGDGEGEDVEQARDEKIGEGVQVAVVGVAAGGGGGASDEGR